ncbi:uncharacterized protein LOC129946244 [Eupeodes corollae]|uniref:uncharacterized protein LOC129946244 n=1 Tax=Eupeodes corollae TaxID=290404 RepID=UPI00248F4939|nr:uncharacterized protein LOC129946244 [Eupeodes corollae]
MSDIRFDTFANDYHTNISANLLSLPFVHPSPRSYILDDGDEEDFSTPLNIPYVVFEILVAIFAIVGNLMVIIVFHRERKLRRRTNYYIVSLAIADFLVGLLGVPFAVLASVGLPRNLHACLFTVSLLVVLCTISIFCLVAVSVDRYWAILYPMAYSRNVRTKTAIGIISMCWVAGTIVGFLPLFGWHADVENNASCLFEKVMDYNYLVFLYFATIITPALLLLAFYAHIYRVIIKQLRQIVTMNPVGDCSRRSSSNQIHSLHHRMCHGGTMLRVLGAARKRDVKATQNLSIIVLFFMICWIPLYTINCIKAFCPTCFVHPKLTFFCIILSHLNSAVNPVLYAYHLKDFRAALKTLILKVIGVEVQQPVEVAHRFSLASQHRLQSVDHKRSSLQTRIYIDSPIWLRQQQQTLKNDLTVKICPRSPSCITNSLAGVHQTVAAVASATAEIDRGVWNIIEASSCAEKEDNIQKHPSSSIEGRESPYSYDNHNYSSSPDELDYDEVFLNNQEQSVCQATTATSIHDRFRSEDDSINEKYKLAQNALTDSSMSDFEIPRSHLIPASSETTVSYSPSNVDCENCPPLTMNTDITRHSPNIFVIENDTNPLSPPATGHKPKFRKSPRLSVGLVGTRAKCRITRSCSCNGDTELISSNSNNSINILSSNNNNNNTNTNNSNSFGERFSPLKTMSNFIFPTTAAAVVKHSSFVHIFTGSSPGENNQEHHQKMVSPDSCTSNSGGKIVRQRPTSDS